MSRRFRLGLFAVSAAGLGALLLWAVAGLPDFGHYRGPYGNVLNAVVPTERHVSNVLAKLGLRNRAEVAARLSATETPGGTPIEG